MVRISCMRMHGMCGAHPARAGRVGLGVLGERGAEHERAQARHVRQPPQARGLLPAQVDRLVAHAVHRPPLHRHHRARVVHSQQVFHRERRVGRGEARDVAQEAAGA